MKLVFLILAIVFFLLGTFGLSFAAFNVVDLGLAFFAASFLPFGTITI